MSTRKFLQYFLVLICLLPSLLTRGQMITGHWKGRINRQKVEVKIIQNGDRLTGTSYYFESAQHYRKYSIRGYFDPETNSAVWWDDQLIEERSGRISLGTPGKLPLLSRADFNCPGEGRMILEGKAAKKDEENVITGDVRLDKTDRPQFRDDWDFVIDNYLVGGNDPELISEIENSIVPVSNKPVPEPAEQVEPVKPVAKVPVPEKTVTEKTLPPPVTVTAPVARPQTITEKFRIREKKLVKELPLTGDSIELRFYDNAQIDGDSISIFLNDRLLRENIRLTGSAYVLKLAVAELQDLNELTMVAENLGEIPPNTSYMVAIIDGKKHDAYLASTEGSSAMILLRKQ